jgi:hypothetical protein
MLAMESTAKRTNQVANAGRTSAGSESPWIMVVLHENDRGHNQPPVALDQVQHWPSRVENFGDTPASVRAMHE